MFSPFPSPAFSKIHSFISSQAGKNAFVNRKDPHQRHNKCPTHEWIHSRCRALFAGSTPSANSRRHIRLLISAITKTSRRQRHRIIPHRIGGSLVDKRWCDIYLGDEFDGEIYLGYDVGEGVEDVLVCETVGVVSGFAGGCYVGDL